MHYNYDRILVATNTLFNSVANVCEMVRWTKMLAQVRRCGLHLV